MTYREHRVDMFDSLLSHFGLFFCVLSHGFLFFEWTYQNVLWISFWYVGCRWFLHTCSTGSNLLGSKFAGHSVLCVEASELELYVTTSPRNNADLTKVMAERSPMMLHAGCCWDCKRSRAVDKGACPKIVICPLRRKRS